MRTHTHTHKHHGCVRGCVQSPLHITLQNTYKSIHASWVFFVPICFVIHTDVVCFALSTRRIVQSVTLQEKRARLPVLKSPPAAGMFIRSYSWRQQVSHLPAGVNGGQGSHRVSREHKLTFLTAQTGESHSSW